MYIHTVTNNGNKEKSRSQRNQQQRKQQLYNIIYNL